MYKLVGMRDSRAMIEVEINKTQAQAKINISVVTITIYEETWA